MHIPGRSLFTPSPKNLARPTGFGWIFDIFFRKHACWHRRFRIENRLLLRGITAAWSYGMLESQLAILAAVKAPAHFLTVLASTSEILLRNGIFGWFSHMLYRIGPRFQKCVRIWSRALQKKVTAVGRYVNFTLLHIPGRSHFTLSSENIARPSGFSWIFDIFFRKDPR